LREKYKNIKILYAEDEEFIRANAVEFLNRYFESVLEAKNGLEAFEIYKIEKPDIIITDIKMPKLSGLDLAQKIRENDKKTQIIIATAYTNQEYLLKAIELSLVKYLIKPIMEDALFEAIELCMENLNVNDSNIKKLSESAIYDTFNRILTINSEIIKLTKRELLLLDLLVKNSNRSINYQEIENYVYRDKGMSVDAIRSLIRSLRKKLPQHTIENISGVGYKVNLIE